MTLDHRKRVTLCSLIVCAMLTCAFFSLRHGPHHAAFQLAFDLIMLLCFWLQYRYNLKRRQLDTLTRLFPAPPESAKERF